MKLTKKFTTALKAVVALRNSPVTMSNVQLAEATGSTVTVISQVMGNLRKNGIVNVKRGPGGGYSVNPEAGLVSALRISQAIGKRFTTTTEDSTPTNRLNNQIVKAFSDISV